MHHFKRLSILGSMLLSVGLLVAFNPIHASAAPAVTLGCPPAQSQGADNNWVKVIQFRLNGLELNDVFFFTTYPLGTDGIFGSATHTAVVAFQNFAGIGSSGGGVVGNRTWAAMGLCTGYPAQVPSGNTFSGANCPPTESIGNSDTFVEAAQHMINVAANEHWIPQGSWFPLNQDGIFGSGTQAAVVTFQNANHISGGGGVVGNRTWNAMGMCSG